MCRVAPGSPGWGSVPMRCRETTRHPERQNPSRINDLGFPSRLTGTSGDAPRPCHIWSIITWKSHLSPRRITLRPRWHPPSPVKGPSIGNPPTFIGGARCTFVTWPNTEQDRRQCSSTDPAVKSQQLLRSLRRSVSSRKIGTLARAAGSQVRRAAFRYAAGLAPTGRGHTR